MVRLFWFKNILWQFYEGRAESCKDEYKFYGTCAMGQVDFEKKASPVCSLLKKLKLSRTPKTLKIEL